MFKGPVTCVYKGPRTLCKSPFVHVEKKCENRTQFQTNFQFESLRVSH
jgi:hypothetical protein